MLLILANNQTDEFREFYERLSEDVDGGLDYAPYSALLFYFGLAGAQVKVINTLTGRDLTDYKGVYVNGYLKTYEPAVSVAMACKYLGVPFVNKELSIAPSLSKLSMHVKLAVNGVHTPKTIAGAKAALLKGAVSQTDVAYPAVLKRADADRGIDNYKVKGFEEVEGLLESHEDTSLWLLQEFVPNDGFYLVSYYGFEPKFCIFRSLQQRPDKNEQKAHMFKPAGGANASEIPLGEVEPAILAETEKAVKAMDRQIGSVDCLYDASSGRVYVLEVNYNPQLVTIETFKDMRIKAFLDFLSTF